MHIYTFTLQHNNGIINITLHIDQDLLPERFSSAVSLLIQQHCPLPRSSSWPLPATLIRDQTAPLSSFPAIPEAAPHRAAQ